MFPSGAVYNHFNYGPPPDHETGDAWQYDDEDIERLSMIMTLHDIGFEHDEIASYMRLWLQGDSTLAERMRILKQKRDKTLDEIHFQERRLDRLDYLRHQIRKQSSFEKGS